VVAAQLPLQQLEKQQAIERLRLGKSVELGAGGSLAAKSQVERLGGRFGAKRKHN